MLTQGPYFLDMSKEKDESEIAREDCPPNCAAAYPGKFGRNNRGGSVLTKEEFTEVAVRCWIDHFADSEKYQNTLLANKTRYLVRHLKVFKVSAKNARALLVKCESDQARGAAQQERVIPVVEEGAEDGIENVELMEEGENVEHMEEGDIDGGGKGAQSDEEEMDCDDEGE